MLSSRHPSHPRRHDNEALHTVHLTNSFLIQKTPITQAEWRALTGSNPSNFNTCGDDCPVENVSWWEAAAYANLASQAEGLDTCYELTGCSGYLGHNFECTGISVTASGGNPYNCEGYRLPTEAEWEYAARAGTTTPTYAGNFNIDACGDKTQTSIAWYCGNAQDMTHPVGILGANPWGLLDMLGNVAEWTWDYYGLYGGIVTNPTGPTNGSMRMYRGGDYDSLPSGIRAAYRGYTTPTNRNAEIGFRLVRTAP